MYSPVKIELFVQSTNHAKLILSDSINQSKISFIYFLVDLLFKLDIAVFLQLNSILLKIMSPLSIRQPGDVVNEVYSENIKSIIEMCFEVGDDPSSIIEETKHKLQVKEN